MATANPNPKRVVRVPKKLKGGRKPASEKLTPLQMNLLSLMEEVNAGRMTMVQAFLRSGYSKTTAYQQKDTLKRIRKTSEMQSLLDKKGATMEKIADNISKGMSPPAPAKPKPGEKAPPPIDERMRYNWTKLGAQLHGVLINRPDEDAPTEDLDLAEIFGGLDPATRYPIAKDVGFGDEPIVRKDTESAFDDE